jgi:uncharacterized membrane protein (UPF0127 family)
MRWIIGFALALAACSSQAGETVAATPTQAPTIAADSGHHPISGLDVIPLTISQNGTVHHFKVEVARTDQEQTRGLMFREQMGADEGMIFPYDPPRPLSFWMRNTVLPLDIIFIGPDHRIINIHEKTEPYSLDSRRSGGPAIAALELNGGRAAELGFTSGALVEW